MAKTHFRTASRAGGPRILIQGWILRAQTQCQAKHRIMPCLGMLVSIPGVV